MSSQAQAPSFGSAADRTIYAPPDSAAVLGVGYNSITNSLKDTAFLKTDPQTIGGGQNVTYELTQITSSSQLKRSLEVDAAASFSGTLNSVNARAQFANQSSVNRYSAYLVVRVSVINATVRLSSYSLTDEVTAAFDAYDTSTFQRNFLGKYGDMFVKAITTGGELIGIVQFATNTDEEVTQISAHLDGVVKAFSGTIKASADFKTAIQCITTTSQTTVRVYRSGAVDSLPGLDALGQYALDFPTKVRENPRLLSFQVGGYDAAFPLGKADKAPALDTAFSALDQLARLYDGTATIASGLDYIKFHPQQFPNFPQNQLIALENQAEDLSSRIKTAAQGLRSNPFSVSDLDPGLRDQMNSLDARLPARLQLIPKLPKISVVTFGAHGNDSMTPGGYGSQPQARVEVPSGYKIIGGGACARNPAPGSSGSFLKSNGGQFLTACLPLLNPQQWLAKSKDHFTNCKGEIDAWAITIQDPNDIWDVRIERKTFGPSKSNSGRVELPPGYLLTGGGACAGLTETREGDFTNNTLLKASYPEGNAWVARSKDHMHEWSAHLTVCVIGIKLRASTLLPESKLFVGSPQTGEANFNFVVVPDEYQVTCGGFNVEAVAGDQWHVEHLVISSYPWADPNLFPGTRWMVESKWSDVQLAASITPYAIGIKKT